MSKTITTTLAEVAQEVHANYPEGTFLIISLDENGIYHRSIQGDSTALAYSILKLLADFPQIAVIMERTLHNETH